jgi:hypothetical protein
MNITLMIVIFAVLAVVLGSVIALVWWHLADYFFPGTAEKTGQRIFRRRKNRAPQSWQPTVIDFDAPPKRPAGDQR